MQSLFNLMQCIDKLINIKVNEKDSKLKSQLLYPAEEYCMNINSFFLDIGSGFGKPVFHAALQCGCESKGIEVVPARVEFCMDFFFEFISGKKFFEEAEKGRKVPGNRKSEDALPFISSETNLNDSMLPPLSRGASVISQQNLLLTPSISQDNFLTPLNQNPLSTNFTQMNLNKTKFKIYHHENSNSYIDCDINFINRVNLNELNSVYYDEVIRDNTSNLFLELRINQDLIYEECFIDLVSSSNSNAIINNNHSITNGNNVNKCKSILVDDPGFSFTIDKVTGCFIPNQNRSTLQFGKHFILDEINIEITPIDDHLYSNVVKIINNTLYCDNIERDILNCITGVSSYTGSISNSFLPSSVSQQNQSKSRLRNFYEIVSKIENYSILNIISFTVTIFNGKKSFYEMNSNARRDSNKSVINITANLTPQAKKENLLLIQTQQAIILEKKKKNKDLYQELKAELELKEKMLKEQFEVPIDQNLASGIDAESLALKECLTNLIFYPYNEKWYEKTSFIPEDATKYKNYATDKKEHFTHIYSYNKLMSKECRSKIAKILNKTKFKVLAWYSNPKQTKKAGLKNFTFLCRFPMQSTSTEKFNVYVYIKTK